MRTFIVIGADVITPGSTEPFVGLTVTINGTTERIARTLKQAVLDLHKSARGTSIPEKLFDNGYASANEGLKRQFANEIIALVGKTGLGDVTPYKKGDEYIATADSRKVKDGTAKVGDTLIIEADGTRVEGFLNFPLQADELLRRELIASSGVSFLAQMFGMQMPAVATVDSTPKEKVLDPTDFHNPEDETEHEAFGTKPAKAEKAK